MRPFPKLLALFVACMVAVSLGAADTPSDLLAQGRVDDAIAFLQNKLSSAPNDAASHHLLCRAYYALGRWDAGIAECEKAIALEPGNGQFHLWTGRIYGEKADSSSFFTAASFAR